MKNLFLCLISLFFFCGSLFAQSEYNDLTSLANEVITFDDLESETLSIFEVEAVKIGSAVRKLTVSDKQQYFWRLFLPEGQCHFSKDGLVKLSDAISELKECSQKDFSGDLNRKEQSFTTEDGLGIRYTVFKGKEINWSMIIGDSTLYLKDIDSFEKLLNDIIALMVY